MMGENRKKGFWLDPRAKLFLILMCVLASMVAPSLGYQFILVLLIALLGVLFGKWKYAVNAVCFYAVICVLTVWIMTEMTGTLRTMFVAFLGLFHKVYACGMLAGIVLSTTKVSEFLSAMNRGRWQKEQKTSPRSHRIWDMTIFIISQRYFQRNTDVRQQNMQED